MLQVEVIKGLRDERDLIYSIIVEHNLPTRHQVREHCPGYLVDFVMRHVQFEEGGKGAKDAAVKLSQVVVAEVHLADRKQVAEHTPLYLIYTVVTKIKCVKLI